MRIHELRVPAGWRVTIVIGEAAKDDAFPSDAPPSPPNAVQIDVHWKGEILSRAFVPQDKLEASLDLIQEELDDPPFHKPGTVM